MSKKIISIILVVIMLVSAMCISVSAATGKAGNYYYTDIKSYVRGKLIDSYNVGGKTVILVEALRTYGFNVDWDGNARTLTITDTKGTATSSATAAANGAIGAVAGSYYHTDIVTYFNGVAIESYNLGGQTVIPATKLRDFGYDVVWDADNRRVLIQTEPNQVVETPPATAAFENITVKENQYHHGTPNLITNSATFNGMALVTSSDCYIETSLDKKSYIPFRAFADCLGIAYSWDSATATLNVKVPEDNSIKPLNQKIKPSHKTYGAIQYDIKDIVLNIRNGEELHNNVDAILYGSEVFVEAQDLAAAFNFFCVNQVDFYTETMMYMIYSGMVNPYQ